MEFIDANIIVHAFSENDKKNQCRAALKRNVITTSLAIVEAQHALARITDEKHAAMCIKALFKSNCAILSLDRNLIFESGSRVERYNLNIFDLINYTAALLNNCTAILTYDKDFDGLDIPRNEP